MYFRQEELRGIFELTDDEKLLCEINPGFERTVGITRNDAFMTDDYLKFIEFNCDSPGGPMYSDVLT